MEAAYLASGKTGKKAYALLLKQQTLHIQYWKDILAAAGFKENDIPYTWKEYWAFWCDKVQPAFVRRPAPPCSASAARWASSRRTFHKSFLAWVDAYDVKLVDDTGKILVGDAKVRQGLIDALKDYTDLYAKAARRLSRQAGRMATTTSRFNGRTVALTPNAVALDRGQVARRCQQRQARRPAARAGAQGL